MLIICLDYGRGAVWRGRKPGILLALFVAFSLLAAACGGDDDDGGETGAGGDSSDELQAANAPGVDDQFITFGMATPLSGNASSLGIDGQKGAEVFIKWLNDQGGTNGRKWQLKTQDDGFDLQKKVTAVQYLIQQEKVFAVWGDVGSQAVAAIPVFNQSKVPYLFPYALATQMVDPVQPYVFTIVPPSTLQEKALSDYLAEELDGEHVFGILALNSADGQDAINGFKDGGAGKWVKEVQQFERTATSWQPQLVTLKAAGVTDIVLHASDVWTAKILQEAKQLGMDVQFYASTGAVTPKTFELAGNDLVEGASAVSILAAGDDTTVPGVKEFLDAFATYEPGYKPGTFALHSWVTGLITAEAMNNIDGTITRDALVASLEDMSDFDTKGITSPVSFSKDSHLGDDKVLVMKGEGGKWKAVTDWIGGDGNS